MSSLNGPKSKILAPFVAGRGWWRTVRATTDKLSLSRHRHLLIHRWGILIDRGHQRWASQAPCSTHNIQLVSPARCLTESVINLRITLEGREWHRKLSYSVTGNSKRVTRFGTRTTKKKIVLNIPLHPHLVKRVQCDDSLKNYWTIQINPFCKHS